MKGSFSFLPRSKGLFVLNYFYFIVISCPAPLAFLPFLGRNFLISPGKMGENFPITQKKPLSPLHSSPPLAKANEERGGGFPFLF